MTRAEDEPSEASDQLQFCERKIPMLADPGSGLKCEVAQLIDSWRHSRVIRS